MFVETLMIPKDWTLCTIICNRIGALAGSAKLIDVPVFLAANLACRLPDSKMKRQSCTPATISSP